MGMTIANVTPAKARGVTMVLSIVSGWLCSV